MIDPNDEDVENIAAGINTVIVVVFVALCYIAYVIHHFIVKFW